MKNLKKMSFNLASKELSRKELRGIMAGSGGGYCFGQCIGDYQCGSWSMPKSCGCYMPNGFLGYCKYHG